MYVLSLKSRHDFVRLQNGVGNSVKNNILMLLFDRMDQDIISRNVQVKIVRLGLCITKKISKKAVIRNKMKRILREVFKIVCRDHHDLVRSGYDYEIIVRKSLLNFTFDQIKLNLLELLTRLDKEKRYQ